MKSTNVKSFSRSRFLCMLERDELVVLFHQLHPEPIYMQSATWRDLKSALLTGILPSKMSTLISELMTRRLLIGNQDVDRYELEMARERIVKLLNRPTILYLMMAQGCNFTCSYCPIPELSKRYGERLLSFDDAIAGIALWQKHIEDYPQNDDPYFLIFYGGEPLLNREILERLLPYVADKQSVGLLPKKLELMLCTNGSLIDERLSKLLAYHRVMVAVGVDSLREQNDPIRITSNGGSTLILIERAIKQLVDNGVRVVASVTITPANVHRLTEYPEFLRKLDIAQFGFNLMKGKALVHALADSSMEDYCRLAARGVLAGLVDMVEDGQFYEYQLEKKLVALRNGSPFSVDCTCYGNQLVIQPDGQLDNCPFLRQDQGHVRNLSDTFRIGETETVRTWRKRLPLLNDSIRTDNVDVLDGGGCAWSSWEMYGNILVRDTVNTIFVKEVMHELIWTLLPGEKANALRRGKTTHWSYRRIRSLRTAGTESL